VERADEKSKKKNCGREASKKCHKPSQSQEVTKSPDQREVLNNALGDKKKKSLNSKLTSIVDTIEQKREGLKHYGGSELAGGIRIKKGGNRKSPLVTGKPKYRVQNRGD